MLIWCAPEIILIVAKPTYREAVWCLVPIAISVYFFFVYTLIVDVEIYYGKKIYIAIASVIAAVLSGKKQEWLATLGFSRTCIPPLKGYWQTTA